MIETVGELQLMIAKNEANCRIPTMIRLDIALSIFG